MSAGLLMSEHGESLDGAVVTELSAGQSAGALLRVAREEAGLDIAALALSLKVPVKKMEALESDNWDLLHDSAFTRALAASVCRTLKLDPAPVLERLPSLAHKLTFDRGGINTPFHSASGGGRSVTIFRHFSRPLILSVIALLLGATVLILLPVFQPVATKSIRLPAEAVANSLPGASPAEIGGGTVPVGEGVFPGIPVVSSTGASTPIVGTVATALPADNALPAVSPSYVVSNFPSQPDGSLVIFKTSGSSWVEVIDARGMVILRKLMQAGELAGISGVAPLSVLVGKSDVTSVEVRGKQLDLKAISRDNVARFEVK